MSLAGRARNPILKTVFQKTGLLCALDVELLPLSGLSGLFRGEINTRKAPEGDFL